MVLDGMIKWFVGSKAPGPIKLEQQMLEEWDWLGLPIPTLIEQFSEEWDWIGLPIPDLTQQFDEGWTT